MASTMGLLAGSDSSATASTGAVSASGPAAAPTVCEAIASATSGEIDCSYCFGVEDSSAPAAAASAFGVAASPGSVALESAAASASSSANASASVGSIES